MRPAAIRVVDLVKEYEVYQKPLDVALEVLTRRTRHATFRALDGVTFEVARGEVFGIIGANGAGKSTLLKIISGVLEPTHGCVEICGSVTPILELGLGFNPEYSGMDNIYLSGLLYGMDSCEINRKIKDIIDFAGLGEFIGRPVKTYSSGMQARLAFSIATAVEPDILIIDEALAAGDAGFVQKCLRRIRHLCSGGRTVLMVSHGTGLLAQLCQSAMWLESGRIRMKGSSLHVIQAYDLAAHQSTDSTSWVETLDEELAGASDRVRNSPSDNPRNVPVPGLGTDDAAPFAGSVSLALELPITGSAQASVDAAQKLGRQVFRRGPVLIERVELLDAKGQRTARLTLTQPFAIKVYYRVDGSVPSPSLGVALAVNNKADLSPVAQFFTQNLRPSETRESYGAAPDRFKAAPRGALTLAFKQAPFRKGDYILSIGLLPNEPASWEFYEYRHLYYSFSVDDAGLELGAPVMLFPAVSHERTDTVGSAEARAPALPASRWATLRQEIERICMDEGGYPDRWPRHCRCPACGGGPLMPCFAKYGFSHAQCGACGFVCVDPYPIDAILRKLYSGAYYSAIREYFERPRLECGGDGSPFSAPPEILHDIVLRMTAGKATGVWLDAGGGIGAFADLIQKSRPAWQVKLNEFNPQSVAIARELFSFEVVTSDPATLLRNGERFDVVSSVAVLEHVTLPFDFVKSYAALIKPGGWLVTVVPHFSPLNGSVSRGSSPNALPPYHVSLFNEAAIRALFQRVEGLEIVDVEQTGPPAFELIHHVDFGDHWDAGIPTPDRPEPRSIQLRPYDPRVSQALAVLHDADSKLSEYFAERDGRRYLIVYCRKVVS
jgi:ABC-type polysaccharide/polyol phosphate transport system ATPase subunit/SAM-dependent methyltransferase